MTGLAVVGCGAAGAFVGWWAGLLLCPDWGDIGLNAVPWAIGGAVVGGAIGVFVGAQVIG